METASHVVKQPVLYGANFRIFHMELKFEIQKMLNKFNGKLRDSNVCTCNSKIESERRNLCS